MSINREDLSDVDAGYYNWNKGTIEYNDTELLFHLSTASSEAGCVLVSLYKRHRRALVDTVAKSSGEKAYVLLKSSNLPKVNQYREDWWPGVIPTVADMPIWLQHGE
ncbi:hypothetical protein EVAR_67699_1 [Eumeta japonica]|uniref:Uncharacterized protein n=1 Tax=Eumeta variegata TaxID=151549 RepID=A0A4C2A3Y4_EUMVA|nr:hypothetical protein EVAR_67699_1 [Eumeta japonica]